MAHTASQRGANCSLGLARSHLVARAHVDFEPYARLLESATFSVVELEMTMRSRPPAASSQAYVVNVPRYVAGRKDPSYAGSASRENTPRRYRGIFFSRDIQH